MFDFDTLFAELCKVETCIAIDPSDARKMPYNFYTSGRVWEVKTDISYGLTCREIRLYLNLPDDFPEDFPKIFINTQDYEQLKFIPHIDQDYFVCVFDKGRNLVMQKTDLSDFVQFMLSRAKKIISDASVPAYKKTEFDREFKAYWELRYSKGDQVFTCGLSAVAGTGEIKGIRFDEMLAGYEYFLYDNEDDLRKIESLAKLHGIRCEDAGVIIIDKYFNEPPFDLAAVQSLDLIIKAGRYAEFKVLCSSYAYRNILVVFKNSTEKIDEYYGWSYKDFEIQPRKITGVRHKGSKVEYLKNPLIGKQPVRRLTFENMTPERLQLRTTGHPENQKSVALTGLGSVGSNLLFWLKNLPINKYRLIDPESLSIENIKRHFLGFNMIGQKKAVALGWSMMNDYPLVDVEVIADSVKDVIQDNPIFIDDCDFHIVSLGSTMLEEKILGSIEKGILTKPTFIFWVEPYLASGQMLFIMPSDASKALDVIVKTYPYSVLANIQDLRDKTYLIEGSCQTGYFPYSGTNLTHFLSAIFPALRQHIVDGDQTSKIYTWIGDKGFLESENLRLTAFAEQHTSFSLIENTI